MAEFSPEKIILFGSHAWGKPKSDRDIDILVVVKQDDAPPSRRAARTYKCLRGLRVPVEIIVSVAAELKRYQWVEASLSHRIVTQGEVLYG